MKSTALGAENIIFISDAHEKFYYEKLQEVRYQDVYHKASAKMLRCSNQWRSCVSKSGDPTGTAGGEYPWACSSVCSVNVGKRKESIFQQAMRLQRDQYRRIAKTEPTVDLGKDETL